MSNPKLIMADKLLKVLKQVQDTGATALMAEQKIEKALAVADRAYVLQRGRIAMNETWQGPARPTGNASHKSRYGGEASRTPRLH